MPSINPTNTPSITGNSYFGSYFPSATLDSIRKSAVNYGNWAFDCAAEPFREMGKLYTSLSAEGEPKVYTIRERLGLLGELAGSTATVAKQVLHSGGCDFITPYLMNQSGLIPESMKIVQMSALANLLGLPITYFIERIFCSGDAGMKNTVSLNRLLGIKLSPEDLKKTVDLNEKLAKFTRRMTPLVLLNLLQASNIPWYLANLTGVVGAAFAAQTLLEASLVATSLFSGYRMMSEGLLLSKKGESSPEHSENINRVSGLILFFIGLYTGLGSIGYGKKLIEGLCIAKGMSLTQLDLLSKYQALSALSYPKTCTAVIVDGLDSTASLLNAHHSNGGYEVYKHCNTLTVHPKTETELIDFLNFAHKDFKKIDNLVLMGRGYRSGIKLGKGLVLTAWGRGWDPLKEVLNTMENTVAEGGHILALGRDTAKFGANYFSFNFSKLLSKRLRGRHVFGSKVFYPIHSVKLREKMGKLIPVIYKPFFDVSSQNQVAHFITPSSILSRYLLSGNKIKYLLTFFAYLN